MTNVNRYIKARRGRGRSGERLYLQVPVPKDLRPVFGRACIERCLRTDSLKVARIRREEMLPEIKAVFTAARAEPKLENVLAAVRREEMARAQIEWTELIADRGAAAARQTLALLLDDEYLYCPDDREDFASPSESWQRRARRELLRHGLAAKDGAVDAAAVVLLEAYVDGAEMALEGRPLVEAHQRATAHPRPVIPAGSSSPALPSPAQTAVQFRDLLSEWKRERRPVPRTVLDFARAMRRLADYVGHEDAVRLTRADIAGFATPRSSLAGKPHSTRSRRCAPSSTSGSAVAHWPATRPLASPSSGPSGSAACRSMMPRLP
jgi:hypothetical protein